MKFHAFFVLLLSLAVSAAGGARAGGEDFPHWLAGLRRDAAAQGVSTATLDSALRDVAPLPRVLELDQKQPETTLTLGQYLANVVTPARIAKGRQLKSRNKALLRAVSDAYGVPAKTILALWAIESGYGASMGGFKVVDSLATLAYDGRRPDLFRAELIDALKILGRGRFGSGDLKGSWAGAMGQVQFTPSTYLNYAVNFRHDGQPDIWRPGRRLRLGRQLSGRDRLEAKPELGQGGQIANALRQRTDRPAEPSQRDRMVQAGRAHPRRCETAAQCHRGFDRRPRRAGRPRLPCL
jgi:membrane-bound lytic murein transglycosylase B